MAILRKIKPMETWELLDGTGIKNVTHKTVTIVRLSKEEMKTQKQNQPTTEVTNENNESTQK